MSNKQKPNKTRGAAVAAVLCFVAAIAIIGTYTLRDYKSVKQKEQLAQAERTKDITEEEIDSQEASGEAQKAQDLVINTPEKQGAEADERNAEESADSSDGAGKSGAATTSGGSKAVHFDSESKLVWPVDGNVLLSFSMDKTVYFSTLDQFKYNPALIVSGTEGDEVLCGTSGIVKAINVTAQTGTTVNVDIGNGYELFYGQLAEVPVKVGDHVDAKTILGYVGQPTKYYSVEGCNVYMEMRKDGQPVNPMEYLEE